MVTRREEEKRDEGEGPDREGREKKVRTSQNETVVLVQLCLEEEQWPATKA